MPADHAIPPLNAVRRFARRAIFSLTAALVVAGCSETKAPSSDTPIRIGVPVIPPAIGNPYQGITVPVTLALQAIFDTVTTLDSEGNAQPALALSWEQESPLSWVLKLRPGVRFSNGEPFNADALVESAALMASPQGRGLTIGSTLYQIDSAEKIDDLTVRVKLNVPDPLLPMHVAVWRVPAPKQWKTLKLPEGARDAIGSGPFVVTARTDGKLALAANPVAWRKPEAKMLELVMIPDATARLQAFVSGAVDVAMVLQVDDKAAVAGKGGTLHTRLTPQVDFIGFNTEGRNTPLADPRVRLALNMAVNRQMLTTAILRDSTVPTGQLSVPGAFGYKAALKPIPYDPAGARKLLADAGHGSGLKLVMAAVAGEVAGDTVYLQQIATDLKAVGVDVEIRRMPSTREMQDLFKGKLDADLFTWVTRGTDPLIDYRYRACLRPSPARMPFHCEPALTALVGKAQDESDLGKRRALYAQAAAYERERPAGIMLWQRPDFDAVASGIVGYAPVQDILNLDRLKRTPRP